jgi:hypothetical protein
MAAALVAGSVGTAWAQTASPEPRITSAPRSVDYRRSVIVEGRLDNGAPGLEVHLEKSVNGGSWRKVARDLTDDENRVRFRLREVTRSAGYRLLYIDEATGSTERSERIRVAVRARLTLATSKTHVMQGRRLRLYGSLFPKTQGRRVVVAQRVAGEWKRISRARAGDGSFSIYFRPGHVGFRRLRVRFMGDAFNRRATASDSIRVYDPDLATWYGPGLYGNRTACGQRLGYDTLGVAHRSLPCGTKVNILYQGRTITVPVIDRGPYSSADWDLTEETADRLGFSGKETIGTEH